MIRLIQNMHKVLASLILTLAVTAHCANIYSPTVEEKGYGIYYDQAKNIELYPYAVANMLVHNHSIKKIKQDTLKQFKIEPIKKEDIPFEAQEWFFEINGIGIFAGPGLQATGIINKKEKILILAFSGLDFADGSTLIDNANKIAMDIFDDDSGDDDSGDDADAAEKEPSTINANNVMNWGQELCNALKKSDPTIYTKIVLTGTTVGGAVAEYVSLTCDVEAIVFNTLPLPGRLRIKATEHGSNHRNISKDILTNHRIALKSVKFEACFLSYGTRCTVLLHDVFGDYNYDKKTKVGLEAAGILSLKNQKQKDEYYKIAYTKPVYYLLLWLVTGAPFTTPALVDTIALDINQIHINQKSEL